MSYPRNRDSDPQLVWRGKDERDSSDLVVNAQPLYIQEKVHPKVLIDHILNRTKADDKASEPQLDLFGDFNGSPKGADKTEFYQHGQKWSNRMIHGDSLQGGNPRRRCLEIRVPYAREVSDAIHVAMSAVDEVLKEEEEAKQSW